MDALILSRLQFAVATFFHFIFVPLTLGLSIIVAMMETKYVTSGNETYKRMAKFWGKLFLINFALGVVTGLTLEFQFGTNWSRYSAFVGDIFGSLLAVEATVAFFLESTMIAVWIFGWERINKKLHAGAIWLVAIAANMSAFWIIVANGFMQHPVGYVLRNGRAELDNFYEVITNPFALHQYTHTLFASWMLAGFFVLGVSAYHLMRKNEEGFFKKSFNYGLGFALVFSVLVAAQGHSHGNHVAETQPTKLAAMESHWETQTNAPMYLLTIPNFDETGNLVEAIGVPSLLSILAFNDPDAEVKGLNDFPRDEHPPVWITFLSFRIMIFLGMLFPVLAILAYLWRDRLAVDKQWFARVLLYAMPLPLVAIQAGWTVAEVGRQPWIVWGLMRTSDAVSPVTTGQVGFSIIVIIALYTFLGAVDFYLLRRVAVSGPPKPADAPPQ